MSDFVTVEQPTQSNPRRHMPRREMPYYHRHELRQPASWMDWLIALAVGSVAAACASVFGGWPA